MINADLHIHSCLSPCADNAMTPKALVAAAVEAGVYLIALTDHNSVRNCPETAALCHDAGIGFIPGIEVTTLEEIHCVCLFPNLGAAAAFSRWLDSLSSPRGSSRNPTAVRRPVRPLEERALLLMSRRISVDELPDRVHRFDGICWPAHVDKPANSLYAVLGCWPQGLNFDAVELYDDSVPSGLPEGLPQLRTSDAHSLWAIHPFSLPLESADFRGLYNYLKKV